MSDVLESHVIYNEALIEEIIQKTNSRSLEWSEVAPCQFQCIKTKDNIIWEFQIAKIKIGNITSSYTLEINKNHSNHITIHDGPMTNDTFESAVKELYELIEVISLQMEAKQLETLEFLRGI